MNLTRRNFLKLSGAAVLSLTFPHRLAARGMDIPVLMYHNISDRFTEYETAPSLFAAQMEWLCGEGYRAVSLGELDSLSEADAKKAVVITFDDGYASFMDHAFYLLKEYGFKATVNAIGKYAGRFVNEGDPRLSWDECRYLIQSGLVDIGCHTYELHAWEGSSSPQSAISALNKKLKPDLARFSQIFKKETGRIPQVLAWPYGLYDRTSIAIARKAGFKYLLTSNRGYFAKNGDRFEIPRLSMSTAVDLPSFRALIEQRG